LVYGGSSNLQTFSFSLEIKYVNINIDELIDKTPESPPFFPRIPKVFFANFFFK